MNKDTFIADMLARINARAWWLSDWRNNPLIQRSHDPLLQTLAQDMVRGYTERNQNLDSIGMIYTGSHRHEAAKRGYEYAIRSGSYLIPGSKTDSGVKVSARQIGVIVEYPDGRVLWNVFNLADIVRGCTAQRLPVQMRLL